MDSNNRASVSFLGPAHDKAIPRRRLLLLLFISFILITGFMGIEFFSGLIFGSLALIADSVHMLTDSLSIFFSFVAVLLARGLLTFKRTYGYARLEILVTFVNAITLIFTSVYIIVEAVQRISTPVPVLSLPLMGVATIGLFINIVVYGLLHFGRHGTHAGHHHNLLLDGALYHVLSDILGSVLAMLSGLIIWLTSWYLADTILSLLITLLIFRQAYLLLSKTMPILLEATPKHLDIFSMAKDLQMAHPAILDIHHVHVWSLNANDFLTTFHVRLLDSSATAEVLVLLKQVLLYRYGVSHSTIQVEIDGIDCPDLAMSSD